MGAPIFSADTRGVKKQLTHVQFVVGRAQLLVQKFWLEHEIDRLAQDKTVAYVERHQAVLGDLAIRVLEIDSMLQEFDTWPRGKKTLWDGWMVKLWFWSTRDRFTPERVSYKWQKLQRELLVLASL